jgi:hypothetical protein
MVRLDDHAAARTSTFGMSVRCNWSSVTEPLLAVRRRMGGPHLVVRAAHLGPARKSPARSRPALDSASQPGRPSLICRCWVREGRSSVLVAIGNCPAAVMTVAGLRACDPLPVRQYPNTHSYDPGSAAGRGLPHLVAYPGVAGRPSTAITATDARPARARRCAHLGPTEHLLAARVARPPSSRKVVTPERRGPSRCTAAPCHSDAAVSVVSACGHSSWPRLGRIRCPPLGNSSWPLTLLRYGGPLDAGDLERASCFYPLRASASAKVGVIPPGTLAGPPPSQSGGHVRARRGPTI